MAPTLFPFTHIPLRSGATMMAFPVPEANIASLPKVLGRYRYKYRTSRVFTKTSNWNRARAVPITIYYGLDFG